MRLVLSAVAVATLCASPVFAQSEKSAQSETINTRPEPPMLGKHWAKGQAKPDASAGARPVNLVYHNGPVVVSSTTVHPIFWGTKWNDANFVADKFIGIDQFYAGAGNTSYLGTNTEYTQAGGAFVSRALASVPHVVDVTAAPSGAPQTSAILAEVCKVAGSSAVAGDYYPVYVDTPRGSTGYCAWHSWGKCGSKNIQFAFFFNLDGDAGCNPEDTSGSGHSQGLAAIANVSGHELSERQTDPTGTAWYDKQGAENSDKCAWKFGLNTVQFYDPIAAKTTYWKIQGNWSNSAYTNNQGYTDHTYYSGQKIRGCIDGTN